MSLLTRLWRATKHPRRVWNSQRKRWRRLQARLPEGRAQLPENFTFFLTYRCDLRCKMCGQWKEGGYAREFTPEVLRDELSLEELKRVVDDVAPAKPTITLCGGEVLLYRDWLKFVEYVKSRGLVCWLITNATHLADCAERVVELGLDMVAVSLDGPAEIHDEIRGRRGTFEKAMSGLRAVTAAKKAAKSDFPEMHIQCAISDINYRHLYDFVMSLKHLDIRFFNLTHLFYQTASAVEKHRELFKRLFNMETVHWAGYNYPPDGIDPELLRRELGRVWAARNELPFDVTITPELAEDEIEPYYRGKDFYPKAYKEQPCPAVWLSVYILPNGDVSPCPDYVLGNVRDESFLTLWNNEKARALRCRLENGGAFPVCLRCCAPYLYQ